MNIRKLVKASDAEIVAEYLGLEMKRSRTGKRTYILCPGHEARLHRPDKHFGNAEIFRSGYECRACGVYVKTHEMVMEVVGCSSDEAYLIMAKAMDLEACLDDASEEQDEHIPKLRLSKQEAEVIKLYPKFINTIGMENGQNGGESVQDGLYVLYKINPGLYHKMIVERAQEMLNKYIYCHDHFASANADLAYMVYDLLEDKFDNAIYGRIRKALDERIHICRKVINIFSSQIKK